MAGPCDHGGMHLYLPDDAADVARDTVALVRAVLRGDEDGQAAILAHADLRGLVHLLATMAAAYFAACARGGVADPDAAPEPLTEAELQAAEAILIAGLEGPDDELGPGP